METRNMTHIKSVRTHQRTEMIEEWASIPDHIKHMLTQFHKDGSTQTLSVSFKVTKGKEVPYYHE